MYRIAIVEDQETDSQRLQEVISQYSKDYNIKLECQRWKTAEDFLEQYRHQYEIVFMDIRLPGMNGMNAAKKLRETDHAVLLVFLTSLAQYALEGYAVEAVDYIIKPISYAALRLKMPRMLRRCRAEEQEIMIAESNGNSVRLKPSELRYVEIFDHHIHYVTLGGIIRSYGTLKEVEDSLNDGGFFRVNKQTIINMKHVTGVDAENVFLHDRSFPLSRRRRKEFLDVLRNSGTHM